MYYVPYYVNLPMYSYGNQPIHWPVPQEVVLANRAGYGNHNQMTTDFGQKPFVVNMEEATKLNNTYRTAIWTGEHLQITLMTVNVGDDIGLEVHPHVDQFLYIEQGQGLLKWALVKII